MTSGDFRSGVPTPGFPESSAPEPVSPASLHSESASLGLGLSDFTADSRMLKLSALALILGVAGALLAWALLHLIYAATNLFYFQRLSWQFASPGNNHMHWLAA